MKKEKFHIEYVLDKVSCKCLWSQLTTGMGLSAWFADEVKIRDKRYSFRWNREWQSAIVQEEDPGRVIRFRWEDEEDENAYLEFKIHQVELTGTTALEVTDFAEADEKGSAIDLWDTQVANLKRSLGII